LVKVFDRVEIPHQGRNPHGGGGFVLCGEQHLPRVIGQGVQHQAAQGRGERLGADFCPERSQFIPQRGVQMF